MKKVGIIIVNLILLIIVLCFFEIFLYFQTAQELKLRPSYSLKLKEFTTSGLKQEMRNPSGLQYNKKPILIYGCSYAYGYKLNENETFSAQLSEYTKRPVYNFGVPAKGLQHTLVLLREDEKIVPEPEFIFYVFMKDHVRRMFVNCNKIDNTKYLTYKIKNGKLVKNENKYAITERFYLLKNVRNQVYYVLKTIFKKQIDYLTKMYFISINQEIKHKYPNTKFIILDYENGNDSFFNANMIQNLKKSDIEVVSLNKEFNDKLKLDSYKNKKELDSFRHPNGKAWEEVVKYISEKYKL